MLAAFLYIGAARTSAYYAVAPFIGVVLSMIIIGERPNLLFFIALAIMLVGTTYCVSTKVIIVLVKLQSY
ncbi:MAG: EamA family transporter [Muribaculaceae bacterium]|nr:EamA family transporter [Muribaculaceae bacterium]